jgi:hypothetical protein
MMNNENHPVVSPTKKQKGEKVSILKHSHPHGDSSGGGGDSVPNTKKNHALLQKASHKQNSAFGDKSVIGLKVGALTREASLTDRRKKFLEASGPASSYAGSSIGRGAASAAVDNVEEREAFVRAQQVKNPFTLLFLGNLAALKVMAIFLVSLETIITCALTVGMTLYWYTYGQEHDDWQGGGMNYIILAFALTSPVSSFCFSKIKEDKKSTKAQVPTPTQTPFFQSENLTFVLVLLFGDPNPKQKSLQRQLPWHLLDARQHWRILPTCVVLRIIYTWPIVCGTGRILVIVVRVVEPIVKHWYCETIAMPSWHNW